MRSLKVFDLVAETGRGRREDDVLSEIFTLDIVDYFCLSSLNLVFRGLGRSVRENGYSSDQRIRLNV